MDDFFKIYDGEKIYFLNVALVVSWKRLALTAELTSNTSDLGYSVILS